ncbi:DUF308 domain-containing protein [Paeniglutamicibacter terrestris]|uniref:DUF308 domain-containing protein n=1 Tax=Paeniglutamicibacter terrestris TaxID=2723403 RepID=A0ABX1G621_9MICC|nr:DUF308 domain-containing protein [Paeniglutamicibacter terrestris]ASN40401.1 hypothetical protein CGQ24_16235 [Arthrobacter sp. 7749]NKG21702.1 DUF308 domain-containing protein [Paeniglutamicibacter terrestris]
MSLQSPNTGTTLELISGQPDDLRCSALKLISSGVAMDNAATRLEEISEGTTDLKSDAVATVRESAGEVFPDLRKAAIRYEKTGEALKRYAEALDRVQGALQMCTVQGGVDSHASMNALIADIEQAHQTAATKRDQEDTADDAMDDADGFLGIGEGTDEQKAAAKSDLTDAKAAREEADEELAELWGKFDGRVTYWEDAYDEAVSGIEEAFDAAGNDDKKWYDSLNDILSIAAIVLGALAIILASTVLGPILGIIAVVVGVIALAIEIYKMTQGEGDWTSLGLAIIGLVPFGRVLGKSISGLGQVFKGGFKAARSRGAGQAFKAFTKSRASTGRGVVRSSLKGKPKRPVKTKIRGNSETRSNIRRNNRKLEREYQQAKLQHGNEYLSRFNRSFEENPLKFINYVNDGGSAKHRALADYILEHSDDLDPRAVDWAMGTKFAGRLEDSGTFVQSFGLGIYENERQK